MSIKLSTLDFPLAVTGHHALSPVGIGADMTAASLRAGITRYAEHPYYHPIIGDEPAGDEPEPLIASFAPGLDPFLEAPERLYSLALQSLRGLIEVSGLMRSEIKRCGFCLALPEPNEVVKKWRLEQVFVPTLLARANLGVFQRTITNQTGATGMLRLLQEALSWFNEREVDRCIVLGVDSCFHAGLLRSLDMKYRLKTERGVDGFIPGEAASALLLEPANGRRKGSRPPLGWVSPTAMADEARHFGSERLSSGKALSDVIRATLKRLPNGRTINWVLCDLNGESYWASEWGTVLSRLGSLLGSMTQLQHPADCIGDVGAAMGGVLISCALEAFKHNYAIDDRALIWSAADNGNRAAIIIKKDDTVKGGKDASDRKR